MKRILAITTLVLLTFGGVALARAEKVTICHATGSDSNPYVRIVVSQNAIQGHFENNGTPLAGHEDDILKEGDVPCTAPDKDEPNGQPDAPKTPETPVNTLTSPVAPVVEDTTPIVGK